MRLVLAFFALFLAAPANAVSYSFTATVDIIVTYQTVDKGTPPFDRLLSGTHRGRITFDPNDEFGRVTCHVGGIRCFGQDDWLASYNKQTNQFALQSAGCCDVYRFKYDGDHGTLYMHSEFILGDQNSQQIMLNVENLTPVPAPASLLLLLSALALPVAFGRRR